MLREDRAKRDKKIVDLTKAGWSAARIAEQIGVSSRHVQRVRVAAGIGDLSTRPLDENVRDRVLVAVADGWPPSEIRETFGVSKSYLTRNFRGYMSWNEAFLAYQMKKTLEAL